MASVSRRGDQFLGQVRIKRGSIVVFSKSQLFPDERLARSWARRLEEKIEKEGLPDVARAADLRSAS